MDDLLCALCIKACYNPQTPLQLKESSSGEWKGEVYNIGQLKAAWNQGLQAFEPGTGIAIGLYADTIIHGTTICATHALYVVPRLDFAKL